MLVAVRDDAAASPFDVVVKNLAHETKLKNWKAMTPEEKALSKLADVLDQVCVCGGGGAVCACFWGSRVMVLLVRQLWQCSNATSRCNGKATAVVDNVGRGRVVPDQDRPGRGDGWAP